MIFSSIEFIFLFLPFTVLFYWICTKSLKVSIWFLSIASLFYYAYWKFEYLLIIFISIGLNFFIGELISSRRSKGILTIGVGLNLITLGVFKYLNFFIENLNQLSNFEVSPVNIALPLAISFFTFQQIAFLVDCSRGVVKEYNFEKYLLFICFFPQLIAGPIVHHADLIPQFYEDKLKKFNWDNFYEGLFRFSVGLFKKVVIADSLSQGVALIFDNNEAFLGSGQGDVWVGVLFYTFQIYFDFSGYSDMAIGIGKFFNIKLPENFNSPYKALNISQFWRRWHITLSSFLRDYLYIPLGGNRFGSLKRYRNLMATMLLGGIWHGAGWNFLIWGGLHGSFLVVNQLFQGKVTLNKELSSVKFFSWFLTMAGVILSWIFFRAISFDTAINIIIRMFDFSLERSLILFRNNDVILIFFLAIFVYFAPNFQNLKEKYSFIFRKNYTNIAIFILLFIPIYKILFEANRVHEFLYFDF